MKKKILTPMLAQLFQKIAPRIGATVILEPEWNVVGQIIFKNGRKRYFRYTSIDLNPLGASDIAKDKDYANFFMKKMGYPIVPGSKTFFSKEWAAAIGSPKRSIDAAYHYAKTLGFPVIVKPNSGSQGLGVALVHTKVEFYRAMRFVFQRDRVGLIQKPVTGNDYRIVVLDTKIISAYQRIPLNVVGDGKSTIRQLLTKKQNQFVQEGRDTQIKSDDPRIQEKLHHQKLDLQSIPKKGKVVYLLTNANLSTGGDSFDVTRTIHPFWKKIAVKLTSDMGLRMCGVDLMIDGDLSKKADRWYVLEINSAPGLDHYAKSGKAQEKIVEDLYVEVLKSMER